MERKGLYIIQVWLKTTKHFLHTRHKNDDWCWQQHWKSRCCEVETLQITAQLHNVSDAVSMVSGWGKAAKQWAETEVQRSRDMAYLQSNKAQFCNWLDRLQISQFFFLPEENSLMRLGSKARFCFLELPMQMLNEMKPLLNKNWMNKQIWHINCYFMQYKYVDFSSFDRLCIGFGRT